ncbi:MAG: class II aldolase/adducin family protein [Chloroflexi bacterium]|nr:class II aldolase/adducin family protein [Chloroflexota bacterium]MCY3583211.1 class II aldolase/adducin family protein [Chloroflexota bacterium]MCY3715952.1 class II aldolase/adducin family protein [Chloroflexota bacterium]MDE2651523.1 class II aldolase/adducin family protein [Chloroflexota bacterium]MXX50258.1 class II aldolase/adducin family protein [Chloroflexota bacterium]
MPTETELRTLICRIGALMYQNGAIDGTAGNISARLDDNSILLTPSGLATGFLQPEQLIIVDMDGRRVDEPTAANAHLRLTSESAMHLECYRQRADVNGVVHAHPPTAVALTLAGVDLGQCLIPEMVVLLGLVPTAPYSTPSSEENRLAITALIREHDAIMLSNHGSLTVAKSLWDAYLLLESLEHGATIIHRALQISQELKAIPPEQIGKLVDYREQFGLLRNGDRERFARFTRSIASE